MHKIIKDIFAVDTGLYVDKTLILSDIHIGYDEALNKQGILIPRLQFKDMIDNLDRIFLLLKGKRIEKIIINGDLKHEFGKISETEWRHTLRLLDYLGNKCEKIVLIKGNHDTILGPVAKKRNVELKDYEIVGDKILLHGDKLPDEKSTELIRKEKIKTIVIGHEHPAITLKDGPRTERYKCFLLGKWKRKNLVVLPSFSPVVEGTDILKEKLLSPFLKDGVGEFKVFIVGDKVYDFGKAKEMV
jgi:hypothetical protein